MNPRPLHLLQARGLRLGYGQRVIVALDDLAIGPGECLGVFGPNGAGKTTLVRGLCGLLPPLAGQIERPAGLRIAYLPQLRSIDRLWPASALDIASLAVSSRARFGWTGSRKAGVLESMEVMGVADLAHRPFAQLSGGQQQRVLLAGALASGPQLLVLDEPTEGLDLASRHSLLQMLRQQQSMGLALVLISHYIDDLLLLAGRVATLQPGTAPGEPSRVRLTTAVEVEEGHSHFLPKSHSGRTSLSGGRNDPL